MSDREKELRFYLKVATACLVAAVLLWISPLIPVTILSILDALGFDATTYPPL